MENNLKNTETNLLELIHISRVDFLRFNVHLQNNIKGEKVKLLNILIICNRIMFYPAIIMKRKVLLKNTIYVAVFLIVSFTCLSVYQNEKWSEHMHIVKEQIRDDNMAYRIEYKYYSISKGRWLYRLTTPTSTKTRFYEWDKQTNELKQVKEY